MLPSKKCLSLLFFFLPLLIATIEAHAADDSDCAPVGDNPGPVIVLIQQHIPVYEEDSSKTRTEIEQLTTKSGSVGAFSPQGVNFGIRFERAYSSVRAPQAMICLWVTKVDADVSVNKMVIYSAKEYPPGSCRYGEIIEHEHEHYRTFSYLISYYAERLRSEIEGLALPSSSRPWSVPSVKAGERRITALLTGVQQSVYDSFSKENEQRINEFHEQESHKQSHCQS
jgi:hypothetical protein